MHLYHPFGIIPHSSSHMGIAEYGKSKRSYGWKIIRAGSTIRMIYCDWTNLGRSNDAGT